jgi:hypothetical protein
MGFDDFKRGEAVALSAGSHDTLGRIVWTDGATAEVHWERRSGYEHQTTREDVALLRRVHESEAGMSA